MIICSLPPSGVVSMKIMGIVLNAGWEDQVYDRECHKDARCFSGYTHSYSGLLPEYQNLQVSPSFGITTHIFWVSFALADMHHLSMIQYDAQCRDAICGLILGSPPGKVYSKLRSVCARLSNS